MLFVLKITLTPILVALVSLAARRWGPTFGGLIMGLPWMTGPILFFLGLDHGEKFVADTAVGTLLGTVGLASFAFAFSTVARRAAWPLSLLAGFLAYGIVGYSLSGHGLSLWAAAAIGSLALATSYLLITPAPDSTGPGALPWWDIPVRMLATAALIILITMSVDFLGPELSGVAATYPVILTVIGTFTHARWGWRPVIALMRGVALSLQSFVAFFTVLGSTVESFGLIGSFAASSAVALMFSGVFVWYTQRRPAVKPKMGE